MSYFNGYFTTTYFNTYYVAVVGTPVELLIDPGGYVGFIQNLHEEEELMIIIHSFLTMRNM